MAHKQVTSKEKFKEIISDSEHRRSQTCKGSSGKASARNVNTIKRGVNKNPQLDRREVGHKEKRLQMAEKYMQTDCQTVIFSVQSYMLCYHGWFIWVKFCMVDEWSLSSNKVVTSAWRRRHDDLGQNVGKLNDRSLFWWRQNYFRKLCGINWTFFWCGIKRRIVPSKTRWLFALQITWVPQLLWG